MSASSENTNVLMANLVELRRSFDHISNIHDQLRVKALAFIAGEVAIVTFLFSTAIQYPSIIYGQILFFSAVAALCIAFGLLFWAIATVNWKIPSDFECSNTLKEKYSTELSFIEYTNNDYVQVIRHCMKTVGDKAKRFNWTIYLLSWGVIILLLIKYGGPQS